MDLKQIQKWIDEWLHKMECQGVDPIVRNAFQKEIVWAIDKFGVSPRIQELEKQVADLNAERVKGIRLEQTACAEIHALQTERNEYREALEGLWQDVRNKPFDTRYATHLKIARTVLDKYKTQ